MRKRNHTLTDQVLLGNLVEFVDLTAFKSFQSKYSLGLKESIQRQQQGLSLGGDSEGDPGDNSIHDDRQHIHEADPRPEVKPLKEAEARCKEVFTDFAFAFNRCVREEKKHLNSLNSATASGGGNK